MRDLLDEIETLKQSDIGRLVKKRTAEFKENGKSADSIFSELCFCICTANNSAERGLRAQKEIDFCGLSESHLRKKMREVVCRFYNCKTEYILAARFSKDEIIQKIKSARDAKELREWLVGSVKGIGYKEASHFLRNVGFDDVAIIDFHIVDLLEKHKLIEHPKTLTKKTYLKIESILSELAKAARVTLAGLDLYLWYLETGKVLK